MGVNYTTFYSWFALQWHWNIVRMIIFAVKYYTTPYVFHHSIVPYGSTHILNKSNHLKIHYLKKCILNSWTSIWKKDLNKPLDLNLELLKWKCCACEERYIHSFHLFRISHHPQLLNCLPHLKSITFFPKKCTEFSILLRYMHRRQNIVEWTFICCSPCRFRLISSDVWYMHLINCIKRIESVGLSQ